MNARKNEIPTGTSKTRSLESLQALRAIAAWLVVYGHYMQIIHGFQYSSPLGKFFSMHGRFGVDLFFVISGFIMFYTLHGRRMRGHSSKNAFSGSCRSIGRSP